MTLFDCFTADTCCESPSKLDICRVLWEISASQYGTSIQCLEKGKIIQGKQGFDPVVEVVDAMGNSIRGGFWLPQ
jgi:hypothetical protein